MARARAVGPAAYVGVLAVQRHASHGVSIIHSIRTHVLAIAADLARVGITAVARTMNRDDLNSNMTSGNFDMVFSETWGAPCEYM